MANLVILQAGAATPFELVDTETTLGRHPDCVIQLESNMVSRRHAQVIKDGNEYFVEDIGSGNGTFVNGQKIEARTRLNDNDRIKLGPILLRFELKSATAGKPKNTGTAIDLDITSGESDTATIMGTVENVSGFGMLDVHPETKLKAVLEISRSLAGTHDLTSLLPKILKTLFSIFPHADRGCILLKHPETGQMYPAAQKHRRDSEDSTVKLSRTILNKVLDEKTGILSADAANDERFEASESISNLTIRSMMCAPLLNLDGDPMGIINIDTQNPLNQFNSDDLDLLLTVAGQAALSYENARLLNSYVEKQKQDNEMEISRNVQKALLPDELPKVDGWEFFASYDSAQAVGGDYYDAFMLDDKKVCISFGDVAGKGVPGALIMARISSCVRNTLAFVQETGAALAEINNHMCDRSAEGRFVTYVLAIIDLNSNEISLTNAGHMSPLFRRTDGAIDVFDDETIGIPVGIAEDYPYEVVTRTIEPGEMVVIVTDGVDEAMDPQGSLYSKERVIEFVKNGPASAEDLGKALLADVRRHANGRPQNDDITIMTVGRNPV